MRYIVLGLSIFAVCMVGCAGGQDSAGTKDGADMKAGAKTGAKAEGKPIVVEGMAKDGMISALVIDDKGVSYMVPSVGRWSDEFKGNRVRVSGNFVQDDRYMGKTVDGVPQQGTAGNDRIILKAKVELVK
jgi:hypothetical protein